MRLLQSGDINETHYLCEKFFTMIHDENCGQRFLNIMLDCPDQTSRTYCGNLLKFVLVNLKMHEKDKLFEIMQVPIDKYDDEGKVCGKTMYPFQMSISARFITYMTSLLQTRVARSWIRFDQYLDLLFSFIVCSPDHILPNDFQDTSVWLENIDYDNEYTKLGLEFALRNKWIELICDFILCNDSPLADLSKGKRSQMGGLQSHHEPNFQPLTRLLQILSA